MYGDTIVSIEVFYSSPWYMEILSSYLIWGTMNNESVQRPLFILNKIDMKITTDATPALA